jgi:hypothetical protein
MTENPQGTAPHGEPVKTFREELESTGNQLLETVKSLIEQGNVRKIIIKDQYDKTLVEMPLTIGAVAAGALTMFAMPLVIVGSIAALVAKVKIIVERYEDPNDAEREQRLQ